MRTRMLGVTLGLVVLGVTTSLAFATPPSDAVESAKRLGAAIQAAVGRQGGSGLTIDGESVSSATLAVFEANGKVRGLSDTAAHAEAIQALVRQHVFLREIARRGITVSEQEIDAFVAELRVREQGTTSEIKASQQAYREAVGLSEEQYWSSLVVRGTARDILTRNKLARELAPTADAATQLAAVDQLIETLAAKAVIHDAR